LNVEGTAVSDARRGEVLWVRNNASGRRVRCVAVAPGLVKLGGVNE
jgi:flagella basal body P-ring formation protein FlgA